MSDRSKLQSSLVTHTKKYIWNKQEKTSPTTTTTPRKMKGPTRRLDGRLIEMQSPDDGDHDCTIIIRRSSRVVVRRDGCVRRRIVIKRRPVPWFQSGKVPVAKYSRSSHVVKLDWRVSGWMHTLISRKRSLSLPYFSFFPFLSFSLFYSKN